MSDLPNLDGLDADDLRELWATICANPRGQAAEWFPKKPPGYINATLRIGNYCFHKARVKQCRKSDRIELAKIYEELCDRVYTDIPKSFRW